jgi:hypothetical protein
MTSSPSLLPHRFFNPLPKNEPWYLGLCWSGWGEGKREFCNEVVWQQAFGLNEFTKDLFIGHETGAKTGVNRVATGIERGTNFTDHGRRGKTGWS